jgi:hypothetical protein
VATIFFEWRHATHTASRLMHPLRPLLRAVVLALVCTLAACGRTLVTEPEQPGAEPTAPTFDSTTAPPDSTQRCTGQAGSIGRC